MHRRQFSNGQSRRSSAPKRFSAVVTEAEDKNKNAGDGKKSFIPRPTSVSSRSSSVEREGFQSSSRSTQKFARSTSAENIADENLRVENRPRITENAFTPKHLMKTHGGRSAVSVQRTVRKDTRPLTDRAYQMTELAKVTRYLTAREIINPGQSLNNSMTLKLFVHIMNCLLNGLFPRHQLTLSNYCELIPTLMRQLKYPGNITRSWLVTANSSHTWPNVLGLLSWLVDLLSLMSSDVKYIAEDDGETENVLDCEKAKKLFEFTKQRYIDWSENDMPLMTEEDDKFFDDLVLGPCKLLKDKLQDVEKDVQELENLLTETENSEYSAEEKLKIVKTDLEKKKSAKKFLKDKLRNLESGLERSKHEMQCMLIENGHLKQCLADNDCSSSFDAEEIAKLQSKAVSLKNIIKVRDSQFNDISNQCYSSDLTNARLQGKLDKVRLKREAILRECTSQNINPEELQLSLNYGNKDNPMILEEYLTRVLKTKCCLDNVLKEYTVKENSNKAQRKKNEEEIKSLENNILKSQSALQQLDITLAEIQNKSSDIKSQIRNKMDEYSKLEGKLISLKHHNESLSRSISDLEVELQVLDESFLEKEARYVRILECMSEALLKYVKKCRELVDSTLCD